MMFMLDVEITMFMLDVVYRSKIRDSCSNEILTACKDRAIECLLVDISGLNIRHHIALSSKLACLYGRRAYEMQYSSLVGR